jgi:hypothetical protein
MEDEGVRMSEVLENKNIPRGRNNGLTDSVAPAESDPLKKVGGDGKKPGGGGKLKGVLKKSGNRGSKEKKEAEMKVGIDPGLLDQPEGTDPEEQEDPGPSVSDAEEEEEDNKKGKKNSGRRTKPDRLGILASKYGFTKRALIYLIFCGCLIIILFFILILLASLWPSGLPREACLGSAKCHSYSAKVGFVELAKWNCLGY